MCCRFSNTTHALAAILIEFKQLLSQNAWHKIEAVIQILIRRKNSSRARLAPRGIANEGVMCQKFIHVI